MFLRSNFFTMNQICFAKNPNDAPLTVNDRESADIVIYEKLHRFRYRFVWPDRHDIMAITSLAFMAFALVSRHTAIHSSWITVRGVHLFENAPNSTDIPGQASFPFEFRSD